MKKLIIFLILVSATATFAQLVKTGEIRIFSFETDAGKTVVLCKGENESYLVYRFGTTGNIELQYPAELNESSWQLFTYSYYFRGGGKENAGLDLNYLSFTNNGYTYKVYQEYSAEDNTVNAGVSISSMDINDIFVKAIKNSVKGSLVDFRNSLKVKRDP